MSKLSRSERRRQRKAELADPSRLENNAVRPRPVNCPEAHRLCPKCDGSGLDWEEWAGGRTSCYPCRGHGWITTKAELAKVLSPSLYDVLRGPVNDHLPSFDESVVLVLAIQQAVTEVAEMKSLLTMIAEELRPVKDWRAHSVVNHIDVLVGRKKTT